jgi:CBS domain-containing protein
MSNKSASLIMRDPGVCLSPDLTLDKVSDHLTKHNLPGAPVVDAAKNLLGYVSEYDCLAKLMQSTYYCDNTLCAQDVMSTAEISTTAGISLIDLASKFNDNKVNVMPVVETSGTGKKVIGVISRGDVMRELV